MPLTRLSLNLLTTSFIFIGTGMALGSLPLIYAGFAPMILMGLSLLLPEVESVEIDPVDEQLEVSKGEVIELTRTVTFRGGVDYIILYEEVPGPFELVDGENLQLFVKNSGDLRARFSYKLRCTRRGVYEFKEMSYKIRHLLEATTSRKGTLKLNQKITVKPPQASVKRIRDHDRWIALPLSSDAKMQLGIVSHDFKDLTTYKSGDPYRHINWKATARTIQSSTDLPIVNEYEREGYQAVWLFLDASPPMELGNNVANVFEYAVQVTLGLADYYIRRGCMVGFSLYNDDAVSQPDDSQVIPKEGIKDQLKPTSTDLFPADHFPQGDDSAIKSQPPSKLFSLSPKAGRQQLHRIERLIQSTEAKTVSLDLRKTLKLNKTQLESTRTMTFLITSVRRNRMGRLHKELIDIEAASGSSIIGKKRNFLINVQGYNLASKTDSQKVAAQIVKYDEEAMLKSLITREATVINWDPSETSFTSTLVMEATQQ